MWERSASVVLTAALIMGGCARDRDVQLADGGIVEGYPVFSETAAYASYILSEAQIEDAISECMRLQGFTFRPEPRAMFQAETHQALLDPDLSDAEFAERFGFGITTLQEFSFDEPTEAEYAELDSEVDAAVEELYGDMSVAERAAYFEALDGGFDSNGERTSSGCQTDARKASTRSLDRYIDRMPDIKRAKDRFAADARVIDYFADWSECMAEHGFRAETPLTLYNGIFADLVEADSAKDKEAFEATREFEVLSGVASVTCGASTRNLLPVELGEVWRQYAEQIG